MQTGNVPSGFRFRIGRGGEAEGHNVHFFLAINYTLRQDYLVSFFELVNTDRRTEESSFFFIRLSGGGKIIGRIGKQE